MTSRPRQANSEFCFDLPLPKDYDRSDALNFNARDAMNVAEQVDRTGIRKGVMLAGLPVLLDIGLDAEPGFARCRVLVDGALTAALQSQAQEACLSILGLRLDPRDFRKFAASDPLFRPLLKQQPGLRVVQSASSFEALTWAIMGQQINVAFAVSLRRTFIQLAGRRHSSGLWCYPDAQAAANLDVNALTSRQFSDAKAQTLLRLANRIASKDLDLVPSATNTLASISDALLAIKGIGPWTVNYTLLRGYAHPDCSLHGDVAVRAAIQNLTGGAVRPDHADAEAFLKRYSPHRTMAAAHLWASLGNKKSFQQRPA